MVGNPSEALATDNRLEPGRKLRSRLSATNVGDAPVSLASGTTAPEGHIPGPLNRLSNSSFWPYKGDGRLRSTAFLIPQVIRKTQGIRSNEAGQPTFGQALSQSQ